MLKYSLIFKNLIYTKKWGLKGNLGSLFGCLKVSGADGVQPRLCFIFIEFSCDHSIQKVSFLGFRCVGHTTMHLKAIKY